MSPKRLSILGHRLFRRRPSLDELIHAEIDRTGVNGWVSFSVGFCEWHVRWDGCAGYVLAPSEAAAKRALLDYLRLMPDVAFVPDDH